MDINGSTEVVFDNYDPQNIKFLVSFDFVGAICILANSFHNCIIYTVRSPRFKVISYSGRSVTCLDWGTMGQCYPKPP